MLVNPTLARAGKDGPCAMDLSYWNRAEGPLGSSESVAFKLCSKGRGGWKKGSRNVPPKPRGTTLSSDTHFKFLRKILIKKRFNCVGGLHLSLLTMLKKINIKKSLKYLLILKNKNGSIIC